MTKKEKDIFKGIYDKAISDYMSYVMARKETPVDILERACVLTELNTLLFPEEFTEQGA